MNRPEAWLSEGTDGDATLRSFMNWDDIANNVKTNNILTTLAKAWKISGKPPCYWCRVFIK